MSNASTEDKQVRQCLVRPSVWNLNLLIAYSLAIRNQPTDMCLLLITISKTYPKLKGSVGIWNPQACLEDTTNLQDLFAVSSQFLASDNLPKGIIEEKDKKMQDYAQQSFRYNSTRA